MSVTVRPYKRGWQVDVIVRLANGNGYRERRRLRITSKTAAARWGEDCERHLLQSWPAHTQEGGADTERVRAAVPRRTRAREPPETKRHRRQGDGAPGATWCRFLVTSGWTRSRTRMSSG